MSPKQLRRIDCNPPKRLWKFRKWGRHAASLIREGEVYFARPSELNDPFEFHWLERWPKNAAVVDEIMREVLAKEYPNDSIAVRRARYKKVSKEAMDRHATARRSGGILKRTATIKLGLFSASATWEHPLMWSHYADHHRGVAIGIDPIQISGKRFHPVKYADEVARISIADYAKDSRDVFLDLSLRKSAIWEYEQEYRTMNAIGTKRYPGCVRNVIIGVHATAETVQQVERIAEEAQHSISLHRTNLRDDAYALQAFPPIR